jgi:OmpA-OmpF porin, OOP family
LISRTFCVLALLSVAAGAAQADGPVRGAYVGASVGSSLLQDDGLFNGYYDFDDTDQSYNVFAGYRFFRYFSVELRYSNLGSYGLGADDIDISAVSAHAVGIIPFGNSGWEAFGQAGFANLKEEAGGVYDENQFAGVGGIGIRWNISRNVAVAAEIAAFAWQNDDIDSYVYDLGVGTQQISIQIGF